MRRPILALLCLIAFATPLTAQQVLFERSDRIHPVIAERGMVVAQEALAAEVGRQVLAEGGNAVDAAVATGFALAVTLPRAGNIGGGGFMLVHMARTHQTVAIDYRETAPAAASRDMFLGPDGQADPDLSRYSGRAIGVPGTVAGMALALERFGTISLAEAIAPALVLAEKGFVVSRDLADSLEALRNRLRQWPETRRVFFHGDARPLRAGEVLRQPDLARTLRLIAEQGPDGFYRGEIAARIASSVQAAGGSITREDMAAYSPRVRAPLLGRYRGHAILAMPPPSSGGVHLIQMLGMLEAYPMAETGAGAAQTMHWMAEAMRRAYADRSKWLGDSDFVDVPVDGLIDPDYVESLRASIDDDAATPSAAVSPGTPPGAESPQTTHYSVVDAAGNAVANTYTLNFSYGMGMVAEGTGVLMNNEMDDFAAAPGAPNAYGLVGGEANAVAPGKRPLSSMTPTIVMKDGRVFLVTGSPGGARIITTTLQVILNVIDHGMNIAEATAAPRMHHQWQPDMLRIEEGFSPDTLALLRARGHDVQELAAMGSTQSILVDPRTGLLHGAADMRRPGALAAGQ